MFWILKFWVYISAVGEVLGQDTSTSHKHSSRYAIFSIFGEAWT
jgi:hypothetical protein